MASPFDQKTVRQGGTDRLAASGGFWADFRHFFFRGLAALLPTLLTIAILLWAYNFVDRNIGQYITQGMIRLLSAMGEPPAFIQSPGDAVAYGQPVGEFTLDRDGRYIQQTREYQILSDSKAPTDIRRRTQWEIAARKYHLGLLGFAVAILLVYFAGYFVASFVGRSIWRMAESTVTRLPVVNTIYPNVKQVTDFLLSDQKFEFSAVVAVEYPRKGIWSIGFVTGKSIRSVVSQTGLQYVSVFIPSSPTPVTGYAIMVPRSDVIELPWTIDEALRFAISGGVIRPDKENVDPAKSDETLPKGRLPLQQTGEVLRI